MAIILAEAAHDELGQLGYETHQKGDQTGDEVRNYNYYNKPWSYVFRWRNDDMRKAFATVMQQAVDNACIGYGQPARLDYFYAIAKVPGYDPSKLTTKVDCDCSSLLNANVYYTLLSQGIKTAITGHETTAMMPEAYRKSSAYFEDVTSKIDLATGKGLIKGDILVRPMSHTAAVWSVGEDQKQEPAKKETEVKKGIIQTALRLRTAPVSGNVIVTMPKNAVVELGESQNVNGTTWYKTTYDGKTGWASGKYIELTTKANSNIKSGTVQTALYVRQTPVNGAYVCVMPAGATITWDKEEKASNGSVWYHVTYGQYVGWASSKFIK